MEPICVLYARVSTEDQVRNGFSLPAQVRECHQRASELGYRDDQIEALVDEGFSGDAVARPGLNRLRDLVAHPGSVGHVVILDPDRFARSLSLQLIVTEEILRGGARLEFLNFAWQDTPEGKLFYSLRGAIAEYEKAKIRERTRRGREQKARQGLLPVGKSLYGYHFDPLTDQLLPVPAEQAVLRLIRTLMLEGAPGLGRMSAVNVAKWLAERGVPGPKGDRWYASSIARMVRREAYTGTYRVLGGAYPIAIEPLWDKATHEALCNHMQANRTVQRWSKGGRGAYLLTGLLRCGTCGRTMRGHAVKDRRRDYRYYLCGRSPVFPVGSGERMRCDGRHWPADEVDRLAWNALQLVVSHLPVTPSDESETVAERSALEGALAKREAEVERYCRLFAQGVIADETRLHALIATARTAIERLRQGLQQRVGEPRSGKRAPPNTGELPQRTRRALACALIRRATITDGSLVMEGFFRPPCHASRSADRQLER